MKRGTLITTIITVFILNSCLNKSDKNSNMANQSTIGNDTIELIKKHIELQKKTELPEDDIDVSHLYYLTDTDYELGGYLLSKMLQTYGYNFISDSEFNKKVKSFFDSAPDCCFFKKKQHRNFYTLLVYESGDDRRIEETEDDYTFNHIFIFPKYKLISTVPFLSGIVEINNGKVKFNYDEETFNRNKYLFNGSQASLAWLLQNDKEFLKNLLVIFGYDKEDKINEMVLNGRYKSYSEQIPIVRYKIGDLFFTKDCNGKLIIRKGLLDYVRRKTTAIDNRYIYALSTYMDILYTGDEDKAFDYDPTTRFTETEKAEIVANIASIENPAFRKYQMEEGAEAWVRGYNAATGLYNLSVDYPEIISIIKENNYFNISNMKQVIEDLPEEAPPTPGDEE